MIHALLTRAPLRRLAFGFASLALGLGTGLGLTSASAMGPSIVVDAASGRVLHQDRAGMAWYPASLTKMMTTYVVLKRAREGHYTLRSGLKISPKATKQQRTRFGFRAGTVITVETALKIIMVRSANDVSYAIAENISGSVPAFAAQMNAEAQRLGLTSTHFINPHGLPGAGQRTSARDMAVLARALMREFPDYAYLWGISGLRYGNAVMKNTNPLLGRYPGVDGFKTGFICSSGFNLVATANRHGQKLIVVVMGASSSRERAEAAARLLERNFGGGGSDMVVNQVANLGGEPPDMRADICQRRGTNVAALSDDLGDLGPEHPGRADASSPYAALVAQNSASLAVNRAAEGGSLLQPYQMPAEPLDVAVGGHSGMVQPAGSSAPALAGAAAGMALAAQPGRQAAAPGRPTPLVGGIGDRTPTNAPAGSLYAAGRAKATNQAAAAPVATASRTAAKPATKPKPDAKGKATAKPKATAKTTAKTKPDAKAKPHAKPQAKAQTKPQTKPQQTGSTAKKKTTAG